MTWNDHEHLVKAGEEVRAAWSNDIKAARLGFLGGIEAYVAMVRRFGLAAEGALGEISVDEAWQGVERLCAAFFLGVLQEESNIGNAAALLERCAGLLDGRDEACSAAAARCLEMAQELTRG